MTMEFYMTHSSSLPLAGKVAIVTGASRGIGLAIAARLAADGAKVCITARTEEALRDAAKTLPEEQVMFVPGKADDPDHRADVMDRVAAQWGRLDILVNNAGINPIYGKLIDVDLGAARKIIEVNVVSMLAWAQAAYHHPTLGFAGHAGSIVNLSSVTGKTPSPGIGMYGVTKAAVMHLTTTLAAELGPEVRVNAVAPAVVKTDFAKALYEGREADVASGYPMQRLGTPDDIAGAVAYLVSPDASWVSGQTLVIDGGLLATGGAA